jgi:hypothetical protein
MPRLSGAFFVWDPFITANPTLRKVPAQWAIFLREGWNQKGARDFTGLGWGSISLILLHHPLFQLDPQLARQFYCARRIAAFGFARILVSRRHHE